MPLVVGWCITSVEFSQIIAHSMEIASPKAIVPIDIISAPASEEAEAVEGEFVESVKIFEEGEVVAFNLKF